MTDRERDEMILDWMDMHKDGASSGKIGRRYDTRAEYVRTVFQRIERDLARSEAA